jgi:hypothetical protein
MIRTTRFATLFVLAAALLAGCATTQISTAEEKDLCGAPGHILYDRMKTVMLRESEREAIQLRRA